MYSYCVYLLDAQAKKKLYLGQEFFRCMIYHDHQISLQLKGEFIASMSYLFLLDPLIKGVETLPVIASVLIDQGTKNLDG